jgi:hypothetical protein
MRFNILSGSFEPFTVLPKYRVVMKPSKLPASWKTPRARCDEYSSKLFPQ